MRDPGVDGRIIFKLSLIKTAYGHILPYPSQSLIYNHNPV